MQLVLASHNQGKLTELRPLLAPLGVKLISQGALGITEAEEPFHTFLENALTKARHAARASGLPALADDAGLCVDTFGGLPGVDTAHYGAHNGCPGEDGNVRALLQNMQGEKNRRAAMVCTLVALRHENDPEPLVATGRVQGEITHEKTGTGGFGFDPVFFLPNFGCTFAELPPEVKNAHSHRGRAVQAMLALMREYWFA